MPQSLKRANYALPRLNLLLICAEMELPARLLLRGFEEDFEVVAADLDAEVGGSHWMTPAFLADFEETEEKELQRQEYYGSEEQITKRINFYS